MADRKFLEVEKVDEIIKTYRDEETNLVEKETSLKRLERAYGANHIGQMLIESDLSITEEDIVNDYCKSRCMTSITDDALEEFLKINSKLSDKQKLAIKAMMFVFDKWSERYVGSTYIDNRHNVTDDNSIDFGEAYNICSKLIKGEE
jgi:hypothetical protein